MADFKARFLDLLGYVLFAFNFVLYSMIGKIEKKEEMGMDLNIRPMEEKDIPDVQYVAKKSWNHTYYDIIPEEVQNNFLNSAYSDEMLKKRLEQIVFVAEDKGKIVGFINLNETNKPNIYDLTAIYLLPAYQGKGIGTKLIKHSIQEVEVFEEIFLEVEKSNINAVNFYKKLGFKIVDEYDDEFDRHVLKTLEMSLSNV